MEALSDYLAKLSTEPAGAVGAGNTPAMSTPPGTARIAVTEDTVRLDGRVVPLDMTAESRGAAICLLRHLLAAAGNWRSSSELDDMEAATPCGEHSGVRWDRVRQQLPECLHRFIESNRRKGCRLLPTVWHR
jgi:hypothetical protein